MLEWIVIISLFSAMAWGPASAADLPKIAEVVSEARELTKAGKFEKALEKYVWLYDSSQGPDLGRNLLACLADWHFLALKHPPALDALLERVEDAKESVIGGRGTVAEFSVVRFANDQLRQPEQTFDLYRRLSEKQPSKATEFFSIARDLLVPNRAYELYVKHSRGLEAEFKRWESQWRNGPKSMRELFTRQARDLIEVAVGVGKPELAAEFQKRAVEVTGNTSLETAVDVATKRVKEKP